MIAAPTLVTCCDCGGEGFIEVETPGGRFDARMEQWYPDIEERLCEGCYGTGEVTACLHCRHDCCFCKDGT